MKATTTSLFLMITLLLNFTHKIIYTWTCVYIHTMKRQYFDELDMFLFKNDLLDVLDVFLNVSVPIIALIYHLFFAIKKNLVAAFAARSCSLSPILYESNYCILLMITFLLNLTHRIIYTWTCVYIHTMKRQYFWWIRYVFYSKIIFWMFWMYF